MSESLDGSLSFLVRQAWLRMRSAIETELRVHGLSVAQYATLIIVEDHPGCSNADVGRAVSSSRQSANELLVGMEREGLIVRGPHPRDRRTQRIGLTELGRRRLEEARPAVTRREDELESGFTDDQREVVRAWLARMSRT